MVLMHYLRQLYRGLRDPAYPHIETEIECGHHSSALKGIKASSNKDVQQSLESTPQRAVSSGQTVWMDALYSSVCQANKEASRSSPCS
jgi:hypothetical protein